MYCIWTRSSIKIWVISYENYEEINAIFYGYPVYSSVAYIFYNLMIYIQIYIITLTIIMNDFSWTNSSIFEHDVNVTRYNKLVKISVNISRNY